jgi:hypothetical protein
MHTNTLNLERLALSKVNHQLSAKKKVSTSPGFTVANGGISGLKRTINIWRGMKILSRRTANDCEYPMIINVE